MEPPDGLLIKSNRQIPIVTICTDASYDPDLGIGSWACYIRSNDRLVKTGRAIESDIDNSTEAEQVGVANALWLVNKMVDLSKHKLILYCDNESAMLPVRYKNKTGRKKQSAKRRLTFYQKNIEPYLNKAMIVETRHVKGHLERSARQKLKTRHFMNDWCDREAKRILIEFREAFDKKKEEPLDLSAKV